MTLLRLLRPDARGALALWAAALSGCAVTPAYVRPAIDTGAGFGVEARATPQGDAPSEVPADWWKVFANPALDALVEEGLQANPSVRAARHALEAARELRRAQAASLWPQLQATYTPTRTKLAGNLGGNSPGVQGDGTVISTTAGTPAAEGGKAPFNAPVIYNFHTAQVSLAYAVDVFGANREALRASAAQEEVQRLEWQAARITLAANLAAAAIQDGMLREQLRTTQGCIDAARAALTLVERQRHAGHAAAAEEAAQRAAVLAVQQQLPPLQQQLEQNRHVMRALLGSPQDRALPEFRLADFQVPARLPGSLPSGLLEQRPDVRAAEEQLKAATAGLGIARAARLPQFTITGDVGGAAGHLSQMFRPGGRFFDLAANLAAPLFDAGGARHRELAARAGVDQAAAQYRAAVLASLQEVADVLQALAADTDTAALADQSRENAQQAWALARRRQQAGLTDGLATLGAEQAWLLADQQRALALASRLTHTVALCQALGGGWWRVKDPENRSAPS